MLQQNKIHFILYRIYQVICVDMLAKTWFMKYELKEIEQNNIGTIIYTVQNSIEWCVCSIIGSLRF